MASRQASLIAQIQGTVLQQRPEAFSKMDTNQPLLSRQTHVSSDQNTPMSILCRITHAQQL